MRKFNLWLFATIMLLSFSVALTTHAADQSVGVVLMHGKWGSPDRAILDLATDLEKVGFLVVRPEMPWSGRRLYDKGVDSAMAEIDAAVKSLRDKGAKRIFIAGHSLGAAGALRYATRADIDGLILLATGHYPEGKGTRTKMEASVEKAKAMIQANKGDDILTIDDPNSGGRKKSIVITARVFLDYFDPDGPMNSRKNAAAVRPATPVLWVVGTKEEQGARHNGDLTRGKLPQNPASKFVEVDADHVGTPNSSSEQVIAWIRGIVR